MNRKHFSYKLLIVFLMLIGTVSIFLVCKSFSNKDSSIDKVILKSNVNNKASLAVLVEQDDGTYEEVTSWNNIDKKYDFIKSGCIDQNGSKIDNAISFDETTKIATINTNKTAYCYLYFSDIVIDKSSLGYAILSNDASNVSSDLVAGEYRYQGMSGNVTNNYICFGTSDKNTCINNKNTYMYRILGITPEGQVEIVKVKGLSEFDGITRWGTFDATSSSTADTNYVAWPNTNYYIGLNGNKFLTNSTYVPSGWADKIADHNWVYGKINLDIINHSGVALYNYVENNYTDTVTAKIGLIYAYESSYSFDSNTDCKYLDSTSEYPCAGGWLSELDILMDNNATIELMDSFYDGLSYTAFIIPPIDILSGTPVNFAVNNVAPTFYLKSNLTLSGTGTSVDPYLVS